MKKNLIFFVSILILTATFGVMALSAQEKPVLPAGKKKPVPFPMKFQKRMRLLTSEDEQKALKIIEELEPEDLEHLEVMKFTEPERYREILLQTLKEQKFLEMLKKKDPERYKRVSRRQALERKSRKLSREYRESEDQDRKNQIKKELKNLLDELFDLREAEKADEIKRLENELKELRNIVAQRKLNKEKIILQRLGELLGDKKYLEW